MDVSVGAVLDSARLDLEKFIGDMMVNRNIPPSLMDKVVDGVQVTLKQQKAEEYTECMIRMQQEEAKKNEQEGVAVSK